MERDSMVFYRSFSEAIEELEEEDQLKAFWNIIRYGLNGIEPEEKGAANAVFKMSKPQIDRGLHFMEGQNGRRCAEYQKWRKTVFERDNYTCQICKSRGVNLEAHHIKKYSIYPSLRYYPENGITLCRKCHKEVHRNEK